MSGLFIDISPAGSMESLITDEESLVKMFLQCFCIISSSVTATFSSGTGEALASTLLPCIELDQ